MVSKAGTQRNFPSGIVIKNPPFDAGKAGLIPGWGTKLPHASGATKLVLGKEASEPQ